MKLSKSSAHAAFAVAYLASRSHEDGPVQARQVAEHLGVPTDSALKVLQALARNNLIQSQLGRAGGYRLHRLPETITLLDIVEAIDGPIHPQVPAGLSAPIGGVKLLANICQQASDSVRNELSRLTVAELARHQAPMTATCD
jgi:Rrf2 family protein